ARPRSNGGVRQRLQGVLQVLARKRVEAGLVQAELRQRIVIDELGGPRQVKHVDDGQIGGKGTRDQLVAGLAPRGAARHVPAKLLEVVRIFNHGEDVFGLLVLSVI